MLKKPRAFIAKWAGWLTAAGISLAILAWAMLLFTVVGDHPRRWTYTVLPDVPSQSYFSTERPRAGMPPPQIEPVPRLRGGAR